MTTLPHPKIPVAEKPLVALPPAGELAQRGITFEPVAPGTPASPVRLRQNGVCCGTFTSPQAAAATIQRVLPCIFAVLLLVASAGSASDGAVTTDGRGLSLAAWRPSTEGERLLVSIAMVEDWRGRRGAAGEIGRWQMLPAVRAERLREFADRHPATVTEAEIAFAHLRWIKRELARHGVAPIPFNIALVWNAGLTATLSGQAPLRSYDYARRVVADLEAHP